MIIGTRLLSRGARVGRRGASGSAQCAPPDPGSDRAMERLEKNPYYEKYSQRIAALQRAHPAQFEERARAVAPPAPAAPAALSAPAAPDVRQFSSVLNPKPALQNNVAVEDKKLDAIFKTELVKDMEAAEIERIWEEHHRHERQYTIAGAAPAALWAALRARMRLAPTFVLPLPRDHGYEFIMCQSSGHTVHFTPLLAFQVHKENAPECLTMVHYTELEEKGIVLMRGEYDKNVLSGQEAQCLANQFQMYYSGKDPVKSQLLQTFTESPDTFQHMDLISEMESISLA